MDLVGCTPQYWKSITKKDQLLPSCTSAQHLAKVYSYTHDKQKIFKLYQPPCKITTTVAVTETKPIPLPDVVGTPYWILRVNYQTKLLTKITNSKEVGFE